MSQAPQYVAMAQCSAYIPHIRTVSLSVARILSARSVPLNPFIWVLWTTSSPGPAHSPSSSSIPHSPEPVPRAGPSWTTNMTGRPASWNIFTSSITPPRCRSRDSSAVRLGDRKNFFWTSTTISARCLSFLSTATENTDPVKSESEMDDISICHHAYEMVPARTRERTFIGRGPSTVQRLIYVYEDLSR